MLGLLRPGHGPRSDSLFFILLTQSLNKNACQGPTRRIISACLSIVRIYHNRSSYTLASPCLPLWHFHNESGWPMMNCRAVHAQYTHPHTSPHTTAYKMNQGVNGSQFTITSHVCDKPKQNSALHEILSSALLLNALWFIIIMLSTCGYYGGQYILCVNVLNVTQAMVTDIFSHHYNSGC